MLRNLKSWFSTCLQGGMYQFGGKGGLGDLGVCPALEEMRESYI